VKYIRRNGEIYVIAKRDIPAVTFANSEADLNGLLPDSGKSVQFSPLITSPPAPNAQKSRAHKRRFHEPLQADLGRPVLLAKIFLFLKIRNRGCLAPSRLDQEQLC
jgi:hypothetical protein